MESNLPQTVEQFHAQEMNKWKGGVEKKKPCTTCKKKVVKKLPEPIDEVVFTQEEMVKAYHELTNMKGVNKEHIPFISSVYSFIFNEEFDWGCNSCVSTQARKFQNYLSNTLKVKL